MKTTSLLVIISFLALCINGSAASRPNIVLIVADDVSWNDIGAYGHPTIKTPRLDRMAEGGIRFDNAYLTASSCSPSRSSIITGRYPHNTGAEQLHWALPGSQVTFTEKLMEAGYWTGMAGKWHLGDEVRDRFDVVLEKEYEDGTPTGAEDWVTLLKARQKEKPFFLWLAAWDAHRPFFEEDLPVRHSREDVVLPPYYPATETYLDDFLEYYDEIARFDLSVGAVLDELDVQGVGDNTLVIVIADNGRPYARDKATMYDSGMKTPFIARWPVGIRAGSVSESIVSVIDLAPTFLELADTPAPEMFEGRSMTELFENPDTPFRSFAASERNWHDFEDHGRSVRTKRFRYIRNHYNDLPATPSGDTVYHKTWWELVRLNEQGALNDQQGRPFRAPRPKEELYDMEADPLSLHNLAEDPDYQTILANHRKLLDTWMEETGDFIPSIRTPDDFDRLNGKPTKHRLRPRPMKKEIYGTDGVY
jgi:N-sulfoglucosamine sulfohydrolase